MLIRGQCECPQGFLKGINVTDSSITINKGFTPSDFRVTMIIRVRVGNMCRFRVMAIVEGTACSACPSIVCVDTSDCEVRTSCQYVLPSSHP